MLTYGQRARLIKLLHDLEPHVGGHRMVGPPCRIPSHFDTIEAGGYLKRLLRERGIPFRIEPWHLGGDEGAKQVGVFLLQRDCINHTERWIDTCMGTCADTEEEALARFVLTLLECGQIA